MLKGVIFDADGTLLDSMPVWTELGQRYLAKHNIIADKKLSGILAPMSLEESSRYLKITYGLPDTVKTIAADIVEMIRSFYLNEVTLKAGAADLLHHLQERNIPMIIASSNDKALLHHAFARLHIDGCFQDILTCSEWHTNKCEAKIYLTAAQRIGTPPKDTAVFEDALQGIRSAKSAGFITVAVQDVSNLAEEVQLRRTADHFIQSLTDPSLKNI